MIRPTGNGISRSGAFSQTTKSIVYGSVIPWPSGRVFTGRNFQAFHAWLLSSSPLRNIDSSGVDPVIDQACARCFLALHFTACWEWLIV